MDARKQKVPLPGSERVILPGARASGKIDPNETVRVTIILRPRPSSISQMAATVEEMGTLLPKDRRYTTREEFAADHGATAEDIVKVEAFAREYGLDIVEESPARRSVVLMGTVGRFAGAFGIKLRHYKHPRGIFRGRSGPIYLPADLAPSVQAVLGLDNRPQAKSHFRTLRKRAAAGGVSYTPPQVAGFYNFPSGLDGSGQSIGIIELGGGYTTNDLKTYFSKLGIPMPNVLAISVDDGGNSPTGNPNGPDTEVMLDIEVIGSIAPKAQIYVYFAPNTDAGFVDAVSTAVHDNIHRPSILSISWGDAESTWTQQGSMPWTRHFRMRRCWASRSPQHLVTAVRPTG
jgi:kumamolisin